MSWSNRGSSVTQMLHFTNLNETFEPTSARIRPCLSLRRSFCSIAISSLHNVIFFLIRRLIQSIAAAQQLAKADNVTAGTSMLQSKPNISPSVDILAFLQRELTFYYYWSNFSVWYILSESDHPDQFRMCWLYWQMQKVYATMERVPCALKPDSNNSTTFSETFIWLDWRLYIW